MGSTWTHGARAALLAAGLSILCLAGCSDDEAETGYETPEDAIAAHVEAGRTYDLAAGCRLRPPEQIEQFAAADDVDVDGYCEFATAEVTAMADDATKARSAAIYTDPVIEPLSRSDGTWFRITAADGSYEEEVMVVEHDGRWYVGDTEAHIHDDDEIDGHDHDHDHDDLDDGHDDSPSEEEAPPTPDDSQSGAEDQSG